MKIYNLTTIVLLASVLISFPSSVLAAVIGENKYIYKPSIGYDGPANDFRWRGLPRDTPLRNPPKSDVFKNVQPFGHDGWEFNGGQVEPGESHTLSFETRDPRARVRSPFGFFTHNKQRVSEDIQSLGVEGFSAIFNPSGDKFAVNFNLFNDLQISLTGSIQIYINRSGLSNFNVDNFKTLVNETLIFSEPNYSLNPGEGFFNIQTELASLDEYLLIIGTANSNDGFGNFPFALAASPAEFPLSIPEPSSILNFLILGISGARAALKSRK